MTSPRITHGWSGSIRAFLDTPASQVELALEYHISTLFAHGASESQQGAWLDEIDVLRNTFRNLSIARQDCLDWSLVLEYELPLEGGRRPDALVLAPGQLLVLEFKQSPILTRASLDQVAAYARDLSEYHSASHEIPVLPYLIQTSTREISFSKDGVTVISPDLLASYLHDLPHTTPVDLERWMDGEYAPLPTLIAAAKMIFNNEKLPAIRRAESLGVRKAVDALKQIAIHSRESKSRALAFVSGVPGAGKTLVGLQFVYEGADEDTSAIFLSGNGPLVEVLRDALKSKAFVRDLHQFIKTYGVTDKIPAQHIIVFDEAQRAWDAELMSIKNGIPLSEPELLIRIGERLPEWATLVGLIGHGQEIYSGEEAGMEGWSSALASVHSNHDWEIYSPPRFTAVFEGRNVREVPELDLTKSLRSRRAEDLHLWVESLLNGDLKKAAEISDSIASLSFPIRITRDLEEARNYLTDLYSDAPEARTGIIASSKDKVLPSFGILNGFMDASRVKKAAWYNKPSGEPGAGSNLDIAITEFDCQGLELDMALVAWGNDFLWDGTVWNRGKGKSKYPQRDPHQLRKNSYRVLLTRSRDGLVIFIPPLDEFNQTEHALLAAGARILNNVSSLAG
jgi:hypothetical protein